ncbi:hypothetical protein GSI_09415 [Ganoderma sinense ZZ0214-1]|uniref:Uncharacterized protein n=1 Tax=Ganoderma sinense ZZ0214-1 TaxID=1077348 RepID=A0A2G8S6K3_9APHY|nr:hypothetical protein GSI_09415 [Ganoderma sinense ZZ0214-1]
MPSPDQTERITRTEQIRIFLRLAIASPHVHRAIGLFLSAMRFIRRVFVPVFTGVVGLAGCAIRIVLGVLAFFKLPIIALLAGLVMVSVVSFGIAPLWRSAQATLMSFDFCELPMVCAHRHFTSFNICDLPFVPVVVPSCGALPPASVSRADFPGLLAIQHRAFDDLVAGSATNSELIVNVKRAEVAIRDLVVLVKASNLTTKEPLAATLSLFSVDAHRTGRGLQLLMSKTYGTIDRLIAYNTYALRVIEAAHKTFPQDDLHIEATTIRTFQASMASFSAAVSAILVEATTVSASLDVLEERLSTIHALSIQEALDTALAKDELLWQLWTVLGGNRRQLRDLADRASILQSVQQYRALASAYIAATVQALTVVDADLTQLREQLSIQAIGCDSIPVEVQVRSLERSLRRLQESSGSDTGPTRTSHGNLQS